MCTCVCGVGQRGKVGGGDISDQDIHELKTVDHSPSVNLDEDTPK